MLLSVVSGGTGSIENTTKGKATSVILLTRLLVVCFFFHERGRERAGERIIVVWTRRIWVETHPVPSQSLLALISRRSRPIFERKTDC